MYFRSVALVNFHNDHSNLIRILLVLYNYLRCNAVATFKNFLPLSYHPINIFLDLPLDRRLVVKVRVRVKGWLIQAYQCPHYNRSTVQGCVWMYALTHDFTSIVRTFFLERKVVMFGPHNVNRLPEGRDL